MLFWSLNVMRALLRPLRIKICIMFMKFVQFVTVKARAARRVGTPTIGSFKVLFEILFFF